MFVDGIYDGCTCLMLILSCSFARLLAYLLACWLAGWLAGWCVCLFILAIRLPVRLFVYSSTRSFVLSISSYLPTLYLSTLFSIFFLTFLFDLFV